MYHPRQDSTYHGLCYTSCAALVRMRNNSVGFMIGHSNTELCLTPKKKKEGNILINNTAHFIYGYMASDIW